MTAAFSSAFLYWVAGDFHSSDPSEIAQFHRFYDETHVPEVFAANPGFVGAHRYALQIPDERGDLGAAFLAAYEVDGERAAEEFLARETGNGGPPASYSTGPPLWSELFVSRWRVLYQRVAETSAPTVAPGAISIIGIDPPADADDAELAEFNAFYTDHHLPENTDRGGFSRGTRYELRHALKHPAPGCPRYLAVYELEDGSDESARAALAQLKAATETYTQGPSSWLRRSAPWRLWYRRIAHSARAQ
ncbi:DUF4286 family protein [Pseudonocardia acaciae]|uniref:DUF4286 family protein n=1 Tax=Pseudonocardia acaciae TaxID=551276 RepID=UPI00048B5149|nr:DUF4286 family protein [Pseudonocardia acaciae]